MGLNFIHLYELTLSFIKNSSKQISYKNRKKQWFILKTYNNLIEKFKILDKDPINIYELSLIQRQECVTDNDNIVVRFH